MLDLDQAGQKMLSSLRELPPLTALRDRSLFGPAIPLELVRMAEKEVERLHTSGQVDSVKLDEELDDRTEKRLMQSVFSCRVRQTLAKRTSIQYSTKI